MLKHGYVLYVFWVRTWRFGAAVTALDVSTKLLYVESG